MKKFLWILALLVFSLPSGWADPEEYIDLYSDEDSVENLDEDSIANAIIEDAISDAEAVVDSVAQAMVDSVTGETIYDYDDEPVDIYHYDDEPVEKEVTDSVVTYEKVKEYIRNRTVSYGPGNRMEKENVKVKKRSNFFDGFSRLFDLIKGDILIMIIVGIIGVIILICLFVILKSVLYKRNEKRKKIEKLQQIDLLTVDENFEKQMKNLNFREAIRIIYVRTLSLLNNKHFIHWEKAKTPSEYYYEVKEKSLKAPFKGLTHTFLLARYDNIEVTREMVEEALKFEKEIISKIK